MLKSGPCHFCFILRGPVSQEKQVLRSGSWETGIPTYTYLNAIMIPVQRGIMLDHVKLLPSLFQQNHDGAITSIIYYHLFILFIYFEKTNNCTILTCYRKCYLRHLSHLKSSFKIIFKTTLALFILSYFLSEPFILKGLKNMGCNGIRVLLHKVCCLRIW